MNDYDPDEPQDPGDGLPIDEFDFTKTDGFRLFILSLEVEKHAFAFCSPLNRCIHEDVPFSYIHYN